MDLYSVLWVDKQASNEEIKKDYKIGEEMFVFDWKNVTNIVVYDWVFLIPKRKI